MENIINIPESFSDFLDELRSLPGEINHSELFCKPSRTIATNENLAKFLEDLHQYNSLISVDCETDSLDPYTTTLVGISITDLRSKTSLYLPVNHSETEIQKNFSILECLTFFNTVFNLLDAGNPVIYFNQEFDQIVMAIQALKEGLGTSYVRPKSSVDVMHLVDLMQFQGFPSLKDLAVQYRVTEYKDVVSFSRMLSNIFGIEEDTIKSALAKPDINPEIIKAIDMKNTTAAEVYEYACDDTIHTLYVFLLMFDQYVGILENNSNRTDLSGLVIASRNLILQGVTQLFFTFANLNGILVRPSMVDVVIDEVNEEMGELNSNFTRSIRKVMGWPLEGPPPKVRRGRKPKDQEISTPSLFDTEVKL